MELFLAALGLLAATAALMAACGLFPHAPRMARFSCVAGPAGVMAACVCGLAAACLGPWDATAACTLPWGLPFGSGRLELDALGRVFLLPVFGLGAVCAWSGGISMGHEPAGEHNLPAHWLFYTLLVLALALVMAARDAVLFLLAWELMSLSPFFLIEFNDSEPSVRDASWVYLVAAHLGAVVLLGLFALLWQAGGSSAFFGGLDASPALRSLIFILALIGFGAKAGIAPMHVWLPEAHPAAPSHVSALLSGAMINAGLYGIIRVLTLLGPLAEAPAWWGWTLLLLGLSTALCGILKASAQSNLKRLLAYSSVENMGIMLMGCGAGLVGLHLNMPVIALMGFAACLMHMLNHAAFKGLLFLCAGEVLHAVHTVRLDLLGGLQKRMPLVGALFAIGAASIICLPPFNGFMGEFLLAVALASGVSAQGMENQLGLLLSLVGLALVSGLAAATFAKAYGMAFLGEPRTGAASSPHAPALSGLLPLFVPAAACCGMGLAAPQIFSALTTALPLPVSMPAELADGVRGNLALAAAVGAAAALLTLAVVLLRRRLLAGATQRHITWGCGYQKGTARIQYTEASFSEPQAEVFARVMGVQVRTHMDRGYFPARASLDVSAPDRLRSRLYAPLFDIIRRVCDACKIIQSGRIHLYILYMLATLLALLLWGFAA